MWRPCIAARLLQRTALSWEAVPVLRDSPHLAWSVALLKSLGLWGWVPGHSTPTFCSWACFCLLLSQASCANYQSYGSGLRPGGVQFQRRLPGSPHQRPSRQMPRVSTPANLTAHRCPRWGSQPGIPPPGRGVPHCPIQEPSVRFLPHNTEWEGKPGSLLPSCGGPTPP